MNDKYRDWVVARIQKVCAKKTGLAPHEAERELCVLRDAGVVRCTAKRWWLP